MQACYNSNTTALNCIAQAQILKADHLLHGGQKLGQRQVAEHAGLPPASDPHVWGISSTKIWASTSLHNQTSSDYSLSLSNGWKVLLPKENCSVQKMELVVWQMWEVVPRGQRTTESFLMAVPSLPALGSAKNLCSGNTLLTLEDSGNTHW